MSTLHNLLSWLTTHKAELAAAASALAGFIRLTAWGKAHRDALTAWCRVVETQNVAQAKRAARDAEDAMPRGARRALRAAVRRVEVNGSLPPSQDHITRRRP